MELRIKVIPRSARTELAGYLPDGTWRVKIAAAPEKGRANRALCVFLAERFKVPRSKVRIVSGEASTLKRVRID